MGLGGQKDRRDQRRIKRRKKGNRSRGGPIGKNGLVTNVQSRHDEETGVTTTRTEERFQVAIPHPLRRRLKSIFVKRNSEMRSNERWDFDKHVRSMLLVIVFKRPVNGIENVLVNPAKERKLRKMGFTHVVIKQIPLLARDKVGGEWIPGYDERAYEMTFFKPRGGHRKKGDKGGESVYTICDELSVLQWLHENGLESLYTVEYLTSWGFLPKRDEDRHKYNGMCAKAQAFFGRGPQPIQERQFHRYRLLKRLMQLHDEEKGKIAFGRSVIGRRVLEEGLTGLLEWKSYYYSQKHGFAYGVFKLPDARFVMRIDLNARKISIEPLKVDVFGNLEVRAYHDFLTGNGFVEIEEYVFLSITGGIGVLTTT